MLIDLNYHIIEFAIGATLLLSAVCFLIWAYLSGLFQKSEEVKQKVFETEMRHRNNQKKRADDD